MIDLLYFKFRNSFLNYNQFAQLSKNLSQIKLYEIKYKNKIYSSNSEIRMTFRSFLQFKLQSKSRSIISLLISEIFSILIIPFFISYILIKSKRRRIKQKNISLIKFDTENFILPGKYKNTKKQIFEDRFLNLKNLQFIFRIFLSTFKLGYYFNFQFLFKLIKELSLFYPYLNNKNLEKIFVFNEYDFTISLANYICKINHIKLINVQHGDIIISAHYSFLEVDSFYIWEKSYASMLIKMKNLCKIKIFKKNRKLNKVMKNDIIGVLEPQLMHFNYDKIKFKKFKEKLFNQLVILSKNKKVILRTHPRYSAFNLNEFNNKNLVIQSGKDEKAEKFLNKCNILIGTASAMLVDASMMGIKVLVCKNDLVDVLSKYHFFYFKKNVKIINIKNLNKYV